MKRRLALAVLALALLLAALAAGFAVALHVAPERLRVEAERQLTRALGTPVAIGRIRVVPTAGLALEAEEVSAWPLDGEPALRARRVEARLSLPALLLGELRLARLTLENARLRLERTPDGRWNPFPLAPHAEEEAPEARSSELLQPLVVLEGFLRGLLARPWLAREVEVRESELVVLDAHPDQAGPDGAPRTTALRGLRGRLAHPRLRGAHLRARARVFDARGERGTLEWEARRSPRGAIESAIATTALDLEVVAPYVPTARERTRLSGTLSGAVAYETAEPGSGRLEIDLLARDAALEYAPEASSAFGPLEARHADARVVLAIRPNRVQLETARFASGALDLQLEGSVVRPLQPASLARLSVSFRDVELARALESMGWLPEPERDAAGGVASEPVEAGRLVNLTARGTATLRGWQRFFAGRTARLPSGFEVRARVEDARIRVGERDRLESLSGVVSWSGDRVEVKRARGALNGSPLPALDLTLEGVSHLFATDAGQRALRSGGEPLLGLRPLWAFLGSDAEPGDSVMGTGVRLEIERLEHPMFLWPIRGLSAEIAPLESGVHIAATGGTWAGAPIRAEADWIFEPEERVVVSAVAEPPEPDAPAPERGPGWAHGRFSTGPIETPTWRQVASGGLFRAEGAQVHLNDVTIELAPVGDVSAQGSLDLGREDLVPFDLELTLRGGDVDALTQLAGLEPGAATGRVGLHGSLRGALRPEATLFENLAGTVEVDAADGSLRRGIPPVVAAALASDSLNPFASRDLVRYQRVAVVLEFGGGTMRTDSFVLDGPDVRIFASGAVDLATPPHALQAEVAVFLFRVIDRAIERIPLLSALLLGEDSSIQAAYYELSGTWTEPEAKLFPLRTLASGPASFLLERVPRMLRRGFEAIGSVLGGRRNGRPPARAESPAPPPRDS